MAPRGQFIGPFTCNVCGANNKSAADVRDRERATCVSCRSSMRFRAIVLVLSRALFGMDLQLCEFPRLKSLRGLGISDSDIYAERLAECFGYTNTLGRRLTFALKVLGDTTSTRQNFFTTALTGVVIGRA